MQNDIMPDNFGQTIKAARKRLCITQLQLAEKLHITSRYLKSIENSGQKPSYALFIQIIRELGIQADFNNIALAPKNSGKIYMLRAKIS
jgi:transcriptional regulator with XRE-family HTH domain